MFTSSTSVFRLISGIATAALLLGCGNGTGESSNEKTNTTTSQSAGTRRSVSETDARFPDVVRPGSKCNVETVNGDLFQPSKSAWSAGKASHVAGWLIDDSGKSAPSEAKIRIQSVDGTSAWEQKLNTGVERPDVVKEFGGQAGFLKSGFSADLELADVNPGEYVLYLAYPKEQGEQICGGWRFVLSR